MSAGVAALGAVLTVFACAACEGEHGTRIVAVADTDLTIPSEIDAIRFVVDARGMGNDVTTREISLDRDDATLPIVLPIVHRGGPLGPLTVDVIALRRGEPLLDRAARISFVAGRSIELHVALDRACVPDACDDGCEPSRCPSGDIDGSSLPEFVDPMRRRAVGPRATGDAGVRPDDDDDEKRGAAPRTSAPDPGSGLPRERGNRCVPAHPGSSATAEAASAPGFLRGIEIGASGTRPAKASERKKTTIERGLAEAA